MIVCDLDETLLDKAKHVPKINKEAILRAEKEYGVRFVPASGRGYTGMISVLKELGVYQKEGHYTISNNGGILVENRDFTHLTFHAFPYSVAQSLFEYGINKNVCIEVFTAKDVYAFQLNDAEKEWLFMFKSDAVICEENDLRCLKQEPIVKILFQYENEAALRSIASEMKDITDGVASISFSSNRYLEFNPIGVHKGMALLELASYLGIDRNETMAIGDNDNDLEMLKTAGISVAVANANDDIKAVADYVTNKNHEEGAVAEAIEKFIFGQEE